ncbi:MAG: nucleotide exchange factor GrpE [Negativicutes bacterium]|nr:nucleotide exchange factor GrpE [Negativicutes bacterium]
MTEEQTAATNEQTAATNEQTAATNPEANPEASADAVNHNNPEVCMPEEDVAKVLNALAEKNRLLDELSDRHKRLQADFDNFRRRSRQEKEELSLIVSQGIVLQFLPVLDNFERALASTAQDEGLRTGVEMIYRQFAQVLEKLGVEPIQAIGVEFDPKLHEAVMSVEDAGQNDGVIIEELQKGYSMHGKVIRPSMVKVVRN